MSFSKLPKVLINSTSKQAHPICFCDFHFKSQFLNAFKNTIIILARTFHCYIICLHGQELISFPDLMFMLK